MFPHSIVGHEIFRTREGCLHFPASPLIIKPLSLDFHMIETQHTGALKSYCRSVFEPRCYCADEATVAEEEEERLEKIFAQQQPQEVRAPWFLMIANVCSVNPWNVCLLFLQQVPAP